MADAGRQIDLLIDRCYQGLSTAALRVEALHRLRSIMSVDAAFFATVDPETMLFTSVLSEEPLLAAAPRFLDNEFGPRDVNRFTDLASRDDPVASLDVATQGQRGTSRRYSDIMAPLDLGDEARVVLRSRSHAWGVMCLHREAAGVGFSENDMTVLRRIAPHVAEGLRRAQLLEHISGPPLLADAGIVLLDAHLELVSMNAAAERWLAQLADNLWPASMELPVPVYTVAARTVAQSTGSSHNWDDELIERPAQVRMRTDSGDWLLVHASRLDGPGRMQIAVVIEPASPQHLASVLLAARGLTPAQERVTALVLRGSTTREITSTLHISPNTVQEHLKAIFDKFGVRSRRELVAAVMGSAHSSPTI